MRPLNENELVQYINWLKDRVLGAQLQDIVGDRERIVLELYRYRLFWIVIDLRRARPLILFCEEKPPISKQTTPLGLFLAGHAEGLFLERIQLNEKLGRVVELEFCKGERSVSLELTLIPHAPNAIARADEKKISFYRPKDLAEKEGLPPFTAVGGRTSADFEKFEKLYFYPAPEEALPDAAQPKTQKDTTGIAAFIQKNQQLIKKKEEALRKLNEIDFDPEIELNFQVGEKLKTHEPLAAGEEAIFDTRLSRSENMRKLFAQAKRLREKKEGLAARKTVLNSEIGRLKTLLADPQINIGHLPNVVSSSPRVAHDLKPGKEIKVRTLRLREGRHGALWKVRDR